MRSNDRYCVVRVFVRLLSEFGSFLCVTGLITVSWMLKSSIFVAQIIAGFSFLRNLVDYNSMIRFGYMVILKFLFKVELRLC